MLIIEPRQNLQNIAFSAEMLLEKSMDKNISSPQRNNTGWFIRLYYTTRNASLEADTCNMDGWRVNVALLS